MSRNDSHLRDVPAAWLYPCVTPGISVDIFHSFYLSLHPSDKLLIPFVCAGVQFDWASHLQDVPAAWLCPCITHGISVQIVCDFYMSVHDEPFISLNTMHTSIFLVTVYKLLAFIFRALDYFLHVFLQSDFVTFVCLLLRNQSIHAVLMHCISQEVPSCRIGYIFLLMMRTMILRHGYLVCIRHFYARQLNFRRNVHGFYNAGGRLHLYELLYCSRGSLSAYFKFSLPSLFKMIRILSILTYHSPAFACLSSNSTPSASPSLSCDDRPLCHRVLTSV